MPINERLLFTYLPGNSSVQVQPESLKKDPQSRCNNNNNNNKHTQKKQNKLWVCVGMCACVRNNAFS